MSEDWKEINLNAVPNPFRAWLESIGYDGVIRHVEDGRYMVGLVFIHCIYNVQFAEHDLLAVAQMAHEGTAHGVKAKVGSLIYKSDQVNGNRQFCEAMAEIIKAEMKFCDAPPLN